MSARYASSPRTGVEPNSPPTGPEPTCDKHPAPVALAIADPDNPYRYVQVRGRVRLVTEDGAAAHIDSLAKKYLGKDKYPNAAPGEVRLLCEIEPTSASGMG